MSDKKQISLKLIFGLSFLVFIIIVIGFSKTNQSQQTPPMPVEAISITSEDLYAEYDSNEIEADLNYKDKTLRVSGTISSISKTIGDRPVFNLATGKYSHQVAIMFPAKTHDAQLATFKRGDKIEVTGTCRGSILGMIVIER